MIPYNRQSIRYLIDTPVDPRKYFVYIVLNYFLYISAKQNHQSQVPAVTAVPLSCIAHCSGCHTVAPLPNVCACTQASASSSWTTARAQFTDAHHTIILKELRTMVFPPFNFLISFIQRLANSWWCRIVILVRLHYIARCWMLAYVRPISLFASVSLCSIFHRCNSPLDEFGVKYGAFISEHRNVHHVQ